MEQSPVKKPLPLEKVTSKPAHNSPEKEMRNKYYTSLTMDQWRAMVSVFVYDHHVRLRLIDAIDQETTTLMYDFKIGRIVLKKGYFLTGCGQIHMALGLEAKEHMRTCILPAEFTFIPTGGIPEALWDEEKDPIRPQPAIRVKDFGTFKPALDVGLHGTKNARWEVMEDVWEQEDLSTFSEKIRVLKKGTRFYQEGYVYKVTDGAARGILRAKIEGGGYTTISALSIGGKLYCRLVFDDRDGVTFFTEDHDPYTKCSNPRKDQFWGFPKRASDYLNDFC